MQSRGSTIKFTAVVALTVLALSGFSTGRHTNRHHHGGGGGCSSSRQDHDTSTSRSNDGYGGGSSYDRRPGYRSTPTSSSSSGGRAGDGRAELVRCATGREPVTTVRVTNSASRSGTFTVRVTFEDSAGLTLATGTGRTSVGARGSATARVTAPAGVAGRIERCVVDPVATAG
ncbi:MULTISPECIES: hypothetical protein [Streptomyces]|jgi:hypothetical protein|uniref:Secreted protein n=1 Tax=Streptomyces doudnae TaxID=3075536 RepID=A0ABD5EXE4_9ACTN|nr:MULTISPECIES: hypothetical protein [unclassified Streptomyces]MDT0438067.1 hypothetical protein [Streptomyces sp. DSM 41981]MYQ66226.1 hypothetical protein [Streptomyces sp. SID4950]SCE16451.1 hypothetical protein GA0115242_123820 [Streptomyces sp. SolWspMP-5a-2]